MTWSVELATQGLRRRVRRDQTIPVVLGRGTRLWGETYAPMTVTRSFTSSSGIVVATLRVER